MNDHDIQLLSLGAAFGMNFMLFIQIAFGMLDDRRDRKVARAAEAKLKAAEERAAA
ncbi:hypothetical protein ABZ446_01840 [Streptomyces sp. NPDC005813]|uniref:hypothetical protein n=1 Tax=Streptomyces sp. NPDC005813 TaxID=3155592 RepID=UPI0033D52469